MIKKEVSNSRYYHPIEKLFLNISGEGECKSKKQFIEEQNKLFFDSYNSDKESPLERSIFKELFEKLYDIIPSLTLYEANNSHNPSIY